MIGTLLIVVAITLGIETKSLLVGEGANDADHDKIVAAITGGPEVEHLIHIKTLYLGPDELLVAAKLGFAAEKPLAEVAAEIDIVEARVRRAVPTARSIYFEPDVYHRRRLPAPADRRDRHPLGRLTPRGRCETESMEYCTFSEPQQGFTYDDQLAFALATERAGFDGFFRSDHYMRMGAGDPLPGPTDAWTTLAGLARETTRIRLGTLVSSATHRVPAVLAIQVAQVDEMSGGRVELGLGTGWFEAEHRAYGIPFPAKRFGLLRGAAGDRDRACGPPRSARRSTSPGEHYTLSGAPALPKPRQERVPIIVGGGGPRRTPEIAARFATEFNLGFRPESEIAEAFARVRAACERIDRDPATLKLSVALPTIAAPDEKTLSRRAEATGRSLDQFRDGTNICGDATEIAAKVGAARSISALSASTSRRSTCATWTRPPTSAPRCCRSCPADRHCARALAARLEEVPQQSGRLVGAHARDDLGAGRQPPVAHDVVHRAGRARLLVPRAEHEPRHARLQQRAGAHQARLQRDHERAPLEVPRAEGCRGLPHRDDLGVRGGVVRRPRAGCGPRRSPSRRHPSRPHPRAHRPRRAPESPGRARAP